jgi:hypothetical protein
MRPDILTFMAGTARHEWFGETGEDKKRPRPLALRKGSHRMVRQANSG